MTTQTDETLAEVERRHILRTLDRHGGRKGETAAALGVSLKTLYNKLNAYKALGTDRLPDPEAT